MSPRTDSNLQRWCRWLSGPPINCTLADAASTRRRRWSRRRFRARQSARSRSARSRSTRSRSTRFRSTRSRSARSSSGTSRSARSPSQRVNINYSPVGSIPVGSIPVASIPVGSIPVGSIPVSSIDLANSPVGSIPVSSIPVGSIHVDLQLHRPTCPTPERCSATGRCSRPGLTLEQLLRAATRRAVRQHHLRRRDRLHDAVDSERLHGRAADQQPAAEQRHHLRRRARAAAQPGRPELGDPRSRPARRSRTSRPAAARSATRPTSTSPRTADRPACRLGDAGCEHPDRVRLPAGQHAASDQRRPGADPAGRSRPSSRTGRCAGRSPSTSARTTASSSRPGRG